MTTTTGSTQAIPDLLKCLRATAPVTRRVLSAYLDTSPIRTERDAYVPALRDGCKQIRSSLDPIELPGFEKAVRQAEAYLTGRNHGGLPGLAIFASGGDDYFFATSLPRRAGDGFFWGERPALEPLEAILADCERIAVVLFDKERARIFSIYLGAIEETHEIHDYVPGKQATGGWFALAQSRYARHHEDHVLRHARHTIRELSAMLQTRPFEYLLLGGPDEALAQLRHHLTRPLQARVAGALSVELFESDSVVLKAALQAADEIKQRTDRTSVESLLDAASTRHVVLGLRPTLDALNDRRVHRLVIGDGFTGEGGACPSCGRVIVGPVRCAVCETPTRQIGDLREHLLDIAEYQGARVEPVSGEAAALLAPHDWIGAWTRH